MASTVTLESLSIQIDDSIQYLDILTLESLSIQIDDSIQYPDILTFESASLQLFAFDYTVINIPQYGNFYNIRDLKYANSIDLNPTLNSNIQSILNLYSGTVGKKIFNISELKSIATTYPTKIQLTYLESFETIPSENNLTNLVFVDITGNNKHYRIYTKEYIK